MLDDKDLDRIVDSARMVSADAIRAIKALEGTSDSRYVFGYDVDSDSDDDLVDVLEPAEHLKLASTMIQYVIQRRKEQQASDYKELAVFEYHLGRWFESLKDDEAAKKALTTALGAYEEKVTMQKSLDAQESFDYAELEHKVGKFEEGDGRISHYNKAIEILESAVVDDDDEASKCYWLGELHILLGLELDEKSEEELYQHDAAVQWFRKAVRLRGNDFDRAFLGHALVYKAGCIDDPEEARELKKEALVQYKASNRLCASEEILAEILKLEDFLRE